jgi:hypothetical protein
MEFQINDSEIKDLKKEPTQVNGCKSCKDPLSNTQKWLLVLSFYILFSSIYGTYKLIENLVNFF